PGIAKACSVTESPGNSRCTLSRVCSPWRGSLACCSLCWAGTRRGRSCAIASVAAPTRNNATSARLSLTRQGTISGGVAIKASDLAMLQPPLGKTIADRALLAQTPSSVHNRREIGEYRVPTPRRATEMQQEMQQKETVRRVPKARPFARASRALERFTVLDLTRVRAGPTCVRQLADWGANVIKIELPPEPGGGDPLGGPREGSDFQNLHRNKRSMTLNLKAPEALAAFKRMVKKADVVVENFRPDVKRRLGIDYPQLRKVNP